MLGGLGTIKALHGCGHIIKLKTFKSQNPRFSVRETDSPKMKLKNFVRFHEAFEGKALIFGIKS